MLLGRSSHQNVRLRETSQILVGPDLPTKISLQSRDSWTHWNLEPPARYKSYIAAPVNRACTWPAKTVSFFERLKMRKHEDATQGRTKHQINTCLNICSIMLHMPQGLTFNSPYNHRVQSSLPPSRRRGGTARTTRTASEKSEPVSSTACWVPICRNPAEISNVNALANCPRRNASCTEQTGAVPCSPSQTNCTSFPRAQRASVLCSRRWD